MKTVVALSLFLALAHAVGSNHGHLHRKAFVRANARRITMTDNAITSTTEIPQVAIYTDRDGKQARITTEVIVLVPPTQDPYSVKPTTAPLGTTSQSDSLMAKRVNHSPGSKSLLAITTALPSNHVDTAISENSTSDTSSSGTHLSARQAAGGLTGVTYSPYNGDGTCKTASEVNSDFQVLSGQFWLVRIYGVDCNQMNTVLPAAQSIGIQLMLGLFNLDSLDDDMNTLVQGVQANGGWDIVNSVSVGNELVNNGQATAQQMANAVNAARQSLRSAGFNGPVVVVDTFIAVLQYPSICDNSDFCAMNIHPFFDSNTVASSAGQFVTTQVARVRQVLADSNQHVVVTESGWPSQGSSNGMAVPGVDNQAAAVSSLRSDYGANNPGGLILFTAFNDYWKLAEPYTFYAEQYWGMNPS